MLTTTHTPSIRMENADGMSFLTTVEDRSVDLILTDPPYIISRESGMNTLYNTVKENESNNVKAVKTEAEWEAYKSANNIHNDVKKENFIKFGTIYGKKYCVQTDYGKWDEEFTMNTLEGFVREYYKKLRKGGTLIVFFDIWKLTPLKSLLEKCRFKQIRFIEWIKTNPQPLNSKRNYLTNCREVALVAVKGSKPTFHSQYDTGVYRFPLQGGKHRCHPTQKSLLLFEELIRKHSNENDLVMDTFLGSGTTAIAAKHTKRRFCGCEMSTTYFSRAQHLLDTDNV